MKTLILLFSITGFAFASQGEDLNAVNKDYCDKGVKKACAMYECSKDNSKCPEANKILDRAAMDAEGKIMEPINRKCGRDTKCLLDETRKMVESNEHQNRCTYKENFSVCYQLDLRYENMEFQNSEKK